MGKLNEPQQLEPWNSYAESKEWHHLKSKVDFAFGNQLFHQGLDAGFHNKMTLNVPAQALSSPDITFALITNASRWEFQFVVILVPSDCDLVTWDEICF